MLCLFAARLVAMREEKVENMAHETSPAPAKKQRRASGQGTPSPYTTPPGSVGPSMSDDMYMMMDEDEKTSVSMSGGRSGGRGDREVLRVVTDGDTYDDGYRCKLTALSGLWDLLLQCWCFSNNL